MSIEHHIFNKEKILKARSEDEFNLHLPFPKKFIKNILQNDDVITFRNLLHDVYYDDNFEKLSDSIEFRNSSDLVDTFIPLIIRKKMIPIKILSYLIMYMNAPLNKQPFNIESRDKLYIYLLIHNDKFDYLENCYISYLLYDIGLKKVWHDYRHLEDLSDKFSDEIYNDISKFVLENRLFINNTFNSKDKQRQLLLLNKEERKYPESYERWYKHLLVYF